MKFIDRIKRKIVKLCLYPIPVFVFHQVSDVFDPSTMWECDWTETNQFKRNILKLKEKYEFISLVEAHQYLKKDFFRRKKYAVLTCDDGWASILSIIPWLAEQKIHVTMFLNPEYMDGIHYRERDTEKLLTEEDVRKLLSEFPDYVSVGSHGWNHFCCNVLDDNAFTDNVEKCEKYLRKFNGYVPFFAYPHGKRCDLFDKILIERNIVPVYCNGQNCIYDSKAIHRICIDKSLVSKV